MHKCPVCQQSSESLLCGNCGFDDSRNFEKYPTLGKFTAGAESISRLQAQQVPQNKDLLLCPACGSFRFCYDLRNSSFQCLTCRAVLSEAQVQSLKSSQLPKLQSSSSLKGYSAIAAGGKLKGQSNVSDWKDLVAVAAGWFYTVGLKKDGTVLFAGPLYSRLRTVEDWKNIVALAASAEQAVGLREDGTVVSAGVFGTDSRTKTWTDITAVTAGMTHILGLKKDGRVLSTASNSLETDAWTDITAIAAGDGFSVGLRKNGTVVTTGSDTGRRCTSDWRNVTAIAAGDKHIVGLLTDGSVVTTMPDAWVHSWRNVVSIAAGGHVTLALCADGTVRSSDAFIDVSDWKNITAIAAGRTHAVGLQHTV